MAPLGSPGLGYIIFKREETTKKEGRNIPVRPVLTPHHLNGEAASSRENKTS